MKVPTKPSFLLSVIILSSFTSLLLLSSVWRQYAIASFVKSETWMPFQTERVAVCISGDLRTFTIPDVYGSLLHHVVYPLRSRYDTDVFFSVAVDEDTRSSQIKMQSLTDAINLFGPASVNIEAAGVYNGHERKFVEGLSRFEWLRAPSKCGPQLRNSLVRLPHTLFRASQCLQMIKEHERKVGIQYDWVYRIRPDVIMFDDIVMPEHLRSDVYYSNQGRTNVTQRMAKYWISTRGHAGYGAIADQFSISSRNVADSALRAWNAVEDCELYQTGFVPLPEDELRFWLLKTGQAYSAIPLNWAIVRGDSGAECKRLYYQHGIAPDGQFADWKRWIIHCYHYNLQRTQLFPLAAKSKKSLLIESYRTRPSTDIITL